MHTDISHTNGKMRVIGLMSGTSLDGIDCADVEIVRSGGQDSLRFLGFHYKPYPEEVRSELLLLAQGEAGGTRRIALANSLLGRLYADAVAEYLETLPLDRRSPDLIASHGQTLYHSLEPEAYLGYPVKTTLQLGEASCLAERFGCPVVSDFRVRDQAAGGLGAPLVPFVEQALNTHPDLDVVYLNIGGISNITFLPAASRGTGAEEILGFDTGPGNMLLDQAVEHHTDGTETYDEDGAYAAKGKVHEELLSRWMQEPFYHLPPPKNAGRENFGSAALTRMRSEAETEGLAFEDLAATLTRLTARVNAEAIRNWCPRIPSRIIVSGGGSRNLQLLRDLAEEAGSIEVVTGDEVLGYPNDAKEAVAFAYLGYKAWRGEPNNVPRATGASHAVVMGKISR